MKQYLNVGAHLVVVLFLILGASGCDSRRKEEIAALQTQARQDEAQIIALKSALTKAHNEVQRVESTVAAEREAARNKISTLENEFAEKESSAKEGVQAIQADRELLLKRLTIAEARLAVFESAKTKANEEAALAASRTNLTVQLGVTMDSGETKPISNGKVYLMKKSLLVLLPGRYKYEPPPEYKRMVSPTDLGMTAAGAWGKGTGRFAALYGRFVPQIVKAVEQEAISTSVSDFNGRASFDGISPGTYIVLCSTALGGGVVLEKTVTVQGRLAFVSMGNEDALNEYAR